MKIQHSSFPRKLTARVLIAACMSLPVIGVHAAEPVMGAAVKESVSYQDELLVRMEGLDSKRIVLHALEPAQRLASQLSSLLSALGATQVEQRRVMAVPENNQVRYFYSADREAGQAVADALGLIFEEIAVRDFANYTPLPTTGLIEVWLR